MAKVVVSVSGGIGYTALGSLIFSTATFVRGTACKESFQIMIVNGSIMWYQRNVFLIMDRY